MADGYVQVPTDSVGKKVDAAELSVGGAVVERQRMVIGDNSATAQFATVTGGALVCTGTFNVSAMPTVTVTGGVAISGTAQVAIGTAFAISGINTTVTVAGTVVLGAGAALIGDINAISRTVQVAVGTPFTVNNISAAVVLAAGTANIGAVSNAAGTALMGAVSLAAGTANVGMLDSISRTVQVAIGTPFILQGISTTVNTVVGAGTALIGAVSLGAGTANIGLLDSISRTVQVAVGTPFIIQGISTTVMVAGSLSIGGFTDNTTYSTGVSVVTPAGYMFFSASATDATDGRCGAGRMTERRAQHVNLRNNAGAEVGIAAAPLSVKVENTSATASVVLAAGAANIGTINNISATVSVVGSVALLAGTANFGTLNDISRTVQVAVGTPFILQGISTTVQVAVGTPFIIQGISTTVNTVVGAGTALIGAVSNGAGTALMGAVSLAAGTANIGFINNISAPIVLAAGTANIGAVSLVAGTANIGFINNISATVTTQVIGYTPAIMSASHGPKCVTASSSANVTLIATPGAGANIFITQLMVGNMSATLTRARIGTSASIATVVQPCAASGGGFVLNFEPPWMLSASEAALCSVKPNASELYFTVNYFVR